MKKWDLSRVKTDLFDVTPAKTVSEYPQNLPPYKILIADDDEDIHKITRLMLQGFEFEGRSLSLLHAHSGQEALEVCQKNPDIAILFLDVVMETKHSGLDVVRVLRESFGNNLTRIILRTGQPGQAPEEEVIKKYDINDYRLKTELTLKTMNTILYSALRNYRDLVNIDTHRLGLQQIVKSSSKVLQMSSMDDFFRNILYELDNFQLYNINHLPVQKEDKTLDGFVATDKDGDYHIVASAGRYGAFLDENLQDTSLYPKFKGLLTQDKTSAIQILNDGFIVGISSQNHMNNYAYIEGNPENYDFDLINIFTSNYAVALDNFIINNMLQSTQREIIFALAETVESHFEETGSHIKRVTKMMYNFSLLKGYSHGEAELIELASSMHDLGKIAISSDLLKKPGKLTKEEFELIKTHTQHGHRILNSSYLPALSLAAEIAYTHHEKFDGTGYPRGLSGSDIPVVARMMAIVDVFDALTHKRVYKDAMPILDALEYVKSEKGKHFDPEMVDIFIENLDLILKDISE